MCSPPIEIAKTLQGIYEYKLLRSFTFIFHFLFFTHTPMCVSIYNPLFWALPHLHTKRHYINQNDDSCLKGHFYRTSMSVFVFVIGQCITWFSLVRIVLVHWDSKSNCRVCDICDSMLKLMIFRCLYSWQWNCKVHYCSHASGWNSQE